MTGIVTVICLVLALGIALVEAIRALRDQPIGRLDLYATGVAELAVLVYVAVRVADLIGGHHTSGTAIVVAYLIGIALALPVTAALSWAEPTRWGSVVLGSGALVTCVLFARINQIWSPHG